MPDFTAEVVLADLAWAVSSPSLIATDFADDPLDVASVDSAELIEFLGRGPSSKVGHYFEGLIHFWLERVRGFEMIAHGHQVMDGKRTLGELDFIFRDSAGRVNHWETAVKFYLCDAEHQVGGSHFIGPNTADTLERKIERLTGHQLPLSKNEFPEVEIRRAFVKGRIYRHPRQSIPVDIPATLAPDHLTALWIRYGDGDWFEEYDSRGEFQYQILGKPYWLSAAPAELLDVNNLRDRMAEHFKATKQSVHVGISSAGAECGRLFVVADRWPDL